MFTVDGGVFKMMFRPLGEFRVGWWMMVLCEDARYLPGQVGIAFCCLTVSCVSAFGGPDRWNLSYFFGTEYSSDRRRLLGVLLCGFSPIQ